jgi:hypothetical protein
MFGLWLVAGQRSRKAKRLVDSRAASDEEIRQNSFQQPPQERSRMNLSQFFITVPSRILS